MDDRNRIFIVKAVGDGFLLRVVHLMRAGVFDDQVENWVFQFCLVEVVKVWLVHAAEFEVVSLLVLEDSIGIWAEDVEDEFAAGGAVSAFENSA